MNFTFERLSKSNIHHLRLLYYACYKKWVPAGYFEAKYNTPHLTSSQFGCLAFHEGVCVAFTGMIPYLMAYNGKNELSVQSGDSMTHPVYTKRGLFTALMERNYNDLRNEQIAFVWGFPNSNSAKVFTEKLHWLPTETMNGFCIPVASKYTSYLKRKANALYYGANPLQKIFENESVDQYPPNSLTGNEVITTVRNGDYYNYKKFGGSILINIEGISVWLKLNGSLFIGDMDEVSTAELKQLLPTLIKVANRCGATNIYFQSHAGPSVESAFASSYPKFESWRILYYNFNSQFPLNKIRVTMGDLDSF